MQASERGVAPPVIIRTPTVCACARRTAATPDVTIAERRCRHTARSTPTPPTFLIWINGPCDPRSYSPGEIRRSREAPMISDKELRQHVLDELDFEPSVDAAHIGIAARDGVVTLTGRVASYAEKLAAEGAARRVKGVRGIAEEIEVHLPSDKKRSDDEIAERAIKIIDWVSVPSERITVK